MQLVLDHVDGVDVDQVCLDQEQEQPLLVVLVGVRVVVRPAFEVREAEVKVSCEEGFGNEADVD